MPVVEPFERHVVPESPKPARNVVRDARSLFVLTIASPPGAMTECSRAAKVRTSARCSIVARLTATSQRRAPEVERVDVGEQDLDTVDLGLKRDVESRQFEIAVSDRGDTPRSSPRPAPMSITAASRFGARSSARQTGTGRDWGWRTSSRGALPRLVVLAQVFQRADVGETVVALRAAVAGRRRSTARPGPRAADRTGPGTCLGTQMHSRWSWLIRNRVACSTSKFVLSARLSPASVRG